MAQRRYAIGTTPEIIGNHEKDRSSMSITMLPTAIESGNTGRIHVGRGFPPSAVLGATNQGDVLVQGGQILDVAQFPKDPSLHKGQWWAIASAADQIIIVDENIDVEV